MSHPSFVILYVENPQASANFYSALLDLEPIERSATFALFVLNSGLRLGLWSRHTVQPAAAGRGGGAELVLAQTTPAQVDAMHRDWTVRGLPILQSPRDMDFGRTFVALDPDGHRLRVYCAAEAVQSTDSAQDMHIRAAA